HCQGKTTKRKETDAKRRFRSARPVQRESGFEVSAEPGEGALPGEFGGLRAVAFAGIVVERMARFLVDVDLGGLVVVLERGAQFRGLFRRNSLVFRAEMSQQGNAHFCRQVYRVGG